MRCPVPILVSCLLLASGRPGVAAPDPEPDRLAPALARRIAVEDQPLVFEVTLPEGVSLTSDPEGPRVGAPGVSARIRWRLLDPEDEVLREAMQETRDPHVRWETAGVIEPYHSTFPGRLRAEAEVEYRLEGRPVARARGRYEVPRVLDVTPPLTASGGDEETYPAFESRPVGVHEGDELTTTDRLLTPGGEIVSRSPFRAILDDGHTLERAGEGDAAGTLEIDWRNLFDNLAPPFTGTDPSPIGRFGLYLLPQWDLGGSHALVTDPGSSWVDSERLLVREPGGALAFHLLDLTRELPGPPDRAGSFGSGRARLPLPYDRVGEFEVGFYVEDRAWPAANHKRTSGYRFRVVDDIAPLVVVSLEVGRPGQPPFATLDAVNRRWTRGGAAFDLPETFSGPPLDEPLALPVEARRPIPISVLSVDNTRLAREGLRLAMEVPPGSSGSGLKVAGETGARTEVIVPVDGFDPGLVRTRPGEAPIAYLGSAGSYTLRLEVGDVHGNVRRLEVRLEAEEPGFERVRARGSGERTAAEEKP